MATTAEETKLKSFVGTLNRSVSGAIWFYSMQNSRDGSVVYEDNNLIIKKYINILSGYTSGPSFTNCNSSGDGIFLSYKYEKDYQVHCKDGNLTTSPFFKLYNLTDTLYID